VGCYLTHNTTICASPLECLLVERNSFRVARLLEGGVALLTLLLTLGRVYVRLLLLNLAPQRAGGGEGGGGGVVGRCEGISSADGGVCKREGHRGKGRTAHTHMQLISP